MSNYSLLCRLPNHFGWRYFYIPLLGACVLFLLLWAGLSDAILDVVEVFAVGAILSRIINHWADNKGKGLIVLGKLPLRLSLHAVGVFTLIYILSDSPVLPIAWFLGTYDDLVDLIGYCLRD